MDVLKILVEKNIPFIKGLLEPVAHVEYLAAEEFTPATVANADALIVRTRTRCDASLLDGSRCSFIATATIGTDHIDMDYCQERGIVVANAPGCNAPAVAQYVFASIACVIDRPIDQYTIGIVGVGHVGKIVERWARQMGMNVLLCDPPRAEVESTNNFVSLDRIASDADIITFHTPLTRQGKYPTYHICDADFISRLKKSPLVINCARGGVFDTDAVIAALDDGVISNVVVDCWEGEPLLSRTLLEKAVVATPHIAGYSHEGKVRATSMALHALCRHFDLSGIDVAEQVPSGAAQDVTIKKIADSYNPLIDTSALKATLSLPDTALTATFEHLRNSYNYRPEV